jgi:CDP-diacylglycerol--serine O-phosphatidyltransferase
MKISKIEIKEKLYNRRYFVPNSLTLGNMFCGFLAIIYATSNRNEKAVFAILLAILLDGLDGRVARRLNATSKFGIEFDSFSDLVSFGIAPAILVYNWGFRILADEFGVFVCFIYGLCAASRLAKFNIAEPNPKGFVGLPTPGAAGMVASSVFLSPVIEPNFRLVGAGALLMLTLAYLMVSPIGYIKFKPRSRRGMSLINILGLGALIALIWYYNHAGLFLLALGYCLSGPLSMLYIKIKKPEPQRPSEEERAALKVLK